MNDIISTIRTEETEAQCENEIEFLRGAFLGDDNWPGDDLYPGPGLIISHDVVSVFYEVPEEAIILTSPLDIIMNDTVVINADIDNSAMNDETIIFVDNIELPH